MRTMWIFDRRPSSFLKVISLQALYMPLRQLRRAITIYKVASWHEKRLFSKLSNIFIRLSNAFVGPFHLVYWLLSADNTHRWITMIVLCWMVERWSSKMSQNFFIEFCSIDLLLSIKTFYAFFISWKKKVVFLMASLILKFCHKLKLFCAYFIWCLPFLNREVCCCRFVSWM